MKYHINHKDPQAECPGYGRHFYSLRGSSIFLVPSAWGWYGIGLTIVGH